MKYPWTDYGLTHKDLGYTRAGDLLLVLYQRPLVEGEVAKWGAKLGPDPDATLASAEKALGDAEEKVESGMWHVSIRDSILKAVEETRTKHAAWRFYSAVLAGMGG